MRPLGAALVLVFTLARSESALALELGGLSGPPRPPGTAAVGDDPAPCAVADSCTRPGRPGEVAIVFVGDTGYGQGGRSEWGAHAQGQVAARMNGLCPRPDLVFFLGDNVYWTGSPDLFATRFDAVYRPLFDPEQRRVHAALGNHDVKGCRLSAQAAFAPGETCADALGRLVRVDVERDVPPGQPAPEVSAGVAPEVMDRARRVDPAACPPAFDTAYEQHEAASGICYATQALRHASFGYGVWGREPLRYYSVDWPAEAQPAPAAPAVRVLVTDSNTLDDEPEPPRGKGATAAPDRTDQLQLLWIENQLRTAPPEAWRILTMHHPPYTPRGCVFRLLGQCVGGHADDLVLRGGLLSAYEGPAQDPRLATHDRHRPDLVFAAHNHIYARSLALDAAGYPARVPGDGIRYFVTGGGGAPLYRMQPRHARYAASGVFHHFVYMRLQRDEGFFWVIDERGGVRDSGCFSRGDNVDRCIAAGTYRSDVLACGAPVPALEGCPPPTR